MRTTTFTRVLVYKPRYEPHGRPQTYGETREGKRVLKAVLDAMAAGHTVAVREYIEGTHKYMDAEIVWDGDQ